MWEDNLWNEMKRMRRKMNKILGSTEFPRKTSSEPDNYRHALADFNENQTSYEIEVELPGINKEDISIEIVDSSLKIKAEKKQEIKEEGDEEDFIRYHHERTYSGFYRSVSLPEDTQTDNIDAEYKNGVLRIIIPKKKGEKRKKSINIR